MAETSPNTGIRELLEAGVHFGHQTARWDPRMRRYIHGERDGIHVIDLLQTEKLLADAISFVTEVAGKGGTVLFVGTKKQARDSVEDWAERCGMPYVSRRWLGGLLTNFQTISKRISRLHELDSLKQDGQLELLPTKERMKMEAELAKLEFNLGGVRDMQRAPDAVVVIDLNAEEIAVREASRLGIPIVAIVDTNCDPGPVEYVVPGNDDAIRSCGLIIGVLGEAIESSAGAFRQAEDERKAREDAERQRREEEARKKAEAEAAAKAEVDQARAAEAARIATEARAAQSAPAKAPAQARAPAQASPSQTAPIQAPAQAEPRKVAPVNPHPQAVQEDDPEDAAAEPTAAATPAASTDEEAGK